MCCHHHYCLILFLFFLVDGRNYFLIVTVNLRSNHPDCGSICMDYFMITQMVKVIINISTVDLYIYLAYNLTDMCKALLEFVETSSFGDYEFRMKVLKSFQSEMAMLGSMICFKKLYGGKFSLV